MSSPQTILRIGIIGCGEVTQVCHIPTLAHLSHLFSITFLSDVSPAALSHCSQKIPNHTPKTSLHAEDLFASLLVDAILIASPDEYHATHAIAALENNKCVLIEKPMALNRRDAAAIIAAEEHSSGKVMVGYMRRYAPAFEEAVKLVGGMEEILYGRVRDIIGPNAAFVAQSGTFPRKFDDYGADVLEEKAALGKEMVEQGLNEAGVESSDEKSRMWRLLGGLGSHDLSAMREMLGMPQACIGASLGEFWTALFQYPGFAVTYESGIDEVPRFDAHLEVYSRTKSVRVQYDTPYVKGLPITMTVREKDEEGGYRETMLRRTYEDPYTIEFKKFYHLVVNGVEVKTTASDAENDLTIFGMIMKAGSRTS